MPRAMRVPLWRNFPLSDHALSRTEQQQLRLNRPEYEQNTILCWLTPSVLLDLFNDWTALVTWRTRIPVSNAAGRCRVSLPTTIMFAVMVADRSTSRCCKSPSCKRSHSTILSNSSHGSPFIRYTVILSVLAERSLRTSNKGTRFISYHSHPTISVSNFTLNLKYEQASLILRISSRRYLWRVCLSMG